MKPAKCCFGDMPCVQSEPCCKTSSCTRRWHGLSVHFRKSSFWVFVPRVQLCTPLYKCRMPFFSTSCSQRSRVVCHPRGMLASKTRIMYAYKVPRTKERGQRETMAEGHFTWLNFPQKHCITTPGHFQHWHRRRLTIAPQ